MACTSIRKKKGKRSSTKFDISAFKDKYRFNENELIEFRQRFNFLSNAQDMLDKETFRENMGLLGLDTGSSLADRIFVVLDSDKDGHIQLDEYLRYFDILLHGSQDEKYDLTFRMIDLPGKGWFTFEEFKDMILSMLYTWNNLTGSHYNINQNQKLDSFLTIVFKKFDVENIGKVTSKNFRDVVSEEPQLLEIFDYFNQGIIDSVQPNMELDQQDMRVIDDLENLHSRLNQLKEYIGGRTENLELPKEIEKETKLKESIKKDRKETMSPHGELKTPLVSSLDSKIKKTIFFEAFKDELEKQLALKPIRQQSEIVDHLNYQNSLNVKNYEISRRWSQQPSKNEKDDKEKEENLERNMRVSKALEKLKSFDVIYQEDNSGNTPQRDLNSAFSKRSNLEHQKIIEQSPIPIRKKGDLDEEGISPVFPTQEKKSPQEEEKFDLSFPQDLKPVKFQKTEPSVDERRSAKDIFPKRGAVTLDFHTPKTKKLHVFFNLTPLKPKVLDSNLEFPEKGSSHVNLSDSDKKNPLDTAEGEYIKKSNKTSNHNNDDYNNVFELPDMDSFNNRQSQRFTTFHTNGNPLQIQQLTEQIDTLAAETLKIIDEIRNKKRHSVTVPEIQEEQKKAITQNIPKVQSKDQKSTFVSFGHQNWNLVLNMMLGIQIAVKSVSQKSDPVSHKDFKVKFIFELVPRRTQETKDSVKICTFFDYAPDVFHEIRRLYGIKNEDYLRSIGPESMLNNLIKGNLRGLSELTSSGKSGSFFYYSADGKYTLKTIFREEFHYLREILKNYYTHLVENPNTLIIRFFGLHKIRFLKKKGKKEKVYFVIMANVFHTFKEIHIRYDLKGSTVGRETNDTDPSVAKKDLNLIRSKEKIMLPLDIAHTFVETIKKDSQFFQDNHIIDYSLLMGIHHLSPEEMQFNQEHPLVPRKSLYDSRNINPKEGILSSDGTKLYFFGIIDILTHYNSRKKAEYIFKRVVSGKGISAVPPAQYAERFRKFIIGLVDRPQIIDD